jgi:MFS family permease
MRKRFFYGYVIVFVLFILQIAMTGPRTSFGVFIKPLSSEFDWPRALVAGAFSMCSFIMGFSGIIMGWLNDRLGARVVLTICGILVGTGLMLMYFIDSAWQLYLLYGLLVGTGMGGLFAPQMSTVARWFVKRRNVMTGLLMAGRGVGGFVGPPLITWLIYGYSWRSAFLTIGITVFILIILGAQFLRRDPSKMGQVPYGEVNETREKPLPDILGLSLKQALNTRKFWILAIALFCLGFCFLTATVHIVPLAIDRGISPEAAAIILSIMNGTTTAGTILVGLIADRIGTRRSFITCVCLFLSIAFLLLPVTSPWLLGFFMIILAFGSGGIAVIESGLTAELFGLKSHGAMLGCIVFNWTLGGALGTFTAGLVFDTTGSYQWIFLLCGILASAAIILALYLNRIRKTEAVV